MSRQRRPKLPPDVEAALDELRAALTDLYGERLRGLYLYGSYARGDFTEDSDIDLLVAIEGDVQPTREMDRMGEAVSDICLRYSLLIATYPIPAHCLVERQIPFFANVRREAVLL